MLEFIEVNDAGMILVQVVKEVIDVGLGGSSLYALLFEVVGQKIDDFSAVKNSIAILIVASEGLLHSFKLAFVLNDGIIVFVDLLHFVVLLYEVSHIVLVKLRIHIFYCEFGKLANNLNYLI